MRSDSKLPLVTRELALRVGQSEVDHMASWLCAIAELSGNPFDAEVRNIGGATALLGRRLGPLFNRVLGFGDEDVSILDEAVRLYSERGGSCRIDVNPHAVGAATMGKLAEAGFRPFRHHDHLYGVPSLAEVSVNGVEVREIGEDEREIWADVWRQGFLEVTGIAESDGDLFATATSSLVHDSQWTLFLAHCDGQPAAAAGLYVNEGVASLAFGGTLPAFRGKGSQTALLQARIRKAAELGCDLVAAQAALDAGSHRNLQRAGLAVAYTRAFWIRGI